MRARQVSGSTKRRTERSEIRAVDEWVDDVVSRFEIGKDTVQVLTESTAGHVARITTIVTDAVREVAHEVGEWASDVIEMRDAAGAAEQDRIADERSDLSGHR